MLPYLTSIKVMIMIPPDHPSLMIHWYYLEEIHVGVTLKYEYVVPIVICRDEFMVNDGYCDIRLKI